MRYDKGHKEETRRRIVGVAAAEFRQKGIGGVGVADIMKEAGLTHGGFYSHFESKEELVREALADAFQTSRARFKGDANAAGIEGYIRRYLRHEHREHPERGCAAASLTAEVAREPRKTRAAFTANLDELLAGIEARLPGKKSHGGRRRRTAMAVFALLMGTMQLARAIDDPTKSDAMIEAGIEAACALAKG